ncbi:bifunctional ADP-dependent NAD(P)H-hydrate dehydratase/NAD(P)H-hydrate epimerase [Desertifilum sp. FACHB-1129]|uniref:Bifunctional NAD(P)H-hydrate repair enzyme n=1 Tax=Desertifilum tharense IPPAS B-1220 TaxID=1781255 RepID=A0A1E5QIB5_9CYAN|nr:MULTISPECIES: bifunctional ADP-dependent NAD(P)H-hydrate dehydratase/NAD(P)H-hydrate epimerase [Desertifilum]MDA0211145.1 bifunctional ADP-dependent NAD(P)H-hydrate dehydratase/NAD(P)H-hydrate epimerase [Cyanobacteria bacterium FC1]MBD2314725.1 bifunctional ADP-dependent NAD(P)H-hydrate dehydratase/NAD(P)H-hydrate epimerase [Desertifilum sp. FACHB-1129]MBD2320084.1 bifunctional ADP-dependent NAD(P)H-hydrate dehydratase/NAD(P)H-hydrate epimerase [Desertifilum sp. FACHB-866]MBD2330212.1 bifunc
MLVDPTPRYQHLHQIAVSATQMREIEDRLFDSGMPVAALMEKVALLIVRRLKEQILTQFAFKSGAKIGVLVGPGNNGGDALVVARELHFQGYDLCLYHPLNQFKELPQQHFNYARALGIAELESVEAFSECDLIIDGLFGFGLEREISGNLAQLVETLNDWEKPIVSIDIPSGIHTDTGEVLGTAIRATHTFCLGLWKLAFLQDAALAHIGKAELIDFDIPWADIEAVLGKHPRLHRVTAATVKANLPLPRPPVTHKYREGHLLVVCGSRKYAGGAILTGLGARGSGVGMLSIAVPESLKPMVVAQLPEALTIGCPETAEGAIAQLPKRVQLESYNAIALGPGLTPEVPSLVETLLDTETPLVIDADGLNILAQLNPIAALAKRRAISVLTPHAGEFKRLFPEIKGDRLSAVTTAAQQSNAIILLKGSRTAIAHPNGSVWVIPESTPALARGGSGDVLTGLLGGLLAQAQTRELPLENTLATAAWWHAQAGILAAQERTELGVDAYTLSQYLIPALCKL